MPSATFSEAQIVQVRSLISAAVHNERASVHHPPVPAEGSFPSPASPQPQAPSAAIQTGSLSFTVNPANQVSTGTLQEGIEPSTLSSHPPLCNFIGRLALRLLYCKTSNSASQNVTVYRSVSHNPFENLAFEDWLYLNVDLANRRILFLWRNEPTVVIGRHQNPWAECNIKDLFQHNVLLARRKSGGGAVYHDLGNVNITFFTSRASYNRKENLELIVSVLRNRWKLNIEASSRDDILLDGKFKISGSSSKLGKFVAFHHCTLLCHVEEVWLKSLLRSSFSDISSKATASVKSDVANLCSVDPSVNYHDVTEAIFQGFCQTYGFGQQIQMIDIDPSDEVNFPGITTLKQELQDWQWIYGKTPRFNVTFATTLPFGMISLKVNCYHGLVDDVQVEGENDVICSLLNELVLAMKGVKFQASDIEGALTTQINSVSLTGLDRQLCCEFLVWLCNVLQSS